MKQLTIVTFCALLSPSAVHATWKPPTVAEMQAKAAKVLEECEAGRILAINVSDAQSIRFQNLKAPAQRTEQDLKALPCVARQYRDLASYEYMEASLLGID